MSPALSADHGHLTPVPGSFERILVDLLASCVGAVREEGCDR
jgi:hypothetical protein